MKFFALVLLTGYFLAREEETRYFQTGGLKKLLRDWLCYLLCALTGLVAGIFIPDTSGLLLPGAILLAAAIPAILWVRRPACLLGGAMTAYWLLRFPGDYGRMAMTGAIAAGLILFVGFFYLGARERLLRLDTPAAAKHTAGRVFVFFALLILWGLLHQKIVQIF